MGIDPISNIVSTVQTVINKVIPDADARLQATTALQNMQINGEIQLADAQVADDTIMEKAHTFVVYTVCFIVLSPFWIGIVACILPGFADVIGNTMKDILFNVPSPVWTFLASLVGISRTPDIVSAISGAISAKK